MKATITPLGFILILLLAIKIAEVRKWKRKASSAFFIVGQRGRTDEEREWGYGNSFLAGNAKAEKYYFYSAIKKFMPEKPLEPFTVKTKYGKIPCIFYDYYIPKRASHSSLTTNWSSAEKSLTSKTASTPAQTSSKKPSIASTPKEQPLLFSCPAAQKTTISDATPT